MPVHVEPRGGRYCVEEPDGTVVPSGCYDNKPEAVARMQAININTHKPTKSTGIHMEKNMSEEIEVLDPEIADREDSQDDPEEKGLADELGLVAGPTSFAELGDMREAAEKQKTVHRLLSDFMSLVGNVFSMPGSEKNSQIKTLAKEFHDMLPDDEEEDEEEEEKELAIGDKLYVGNTSTEMKIEQKPMLYIWKESDGVYRWLGIYSNKFRDNDNPAEILAEKAHLHFIERVEKGELDYPNLYIWHIPQAIGKADLLAYDDAGFSVVAGTIEEDYAIVLEKSSEDLAMSHGMPSQYIRRDKEDPTIIVEYVSAEVSILPRRAAANKMTEFLITKDEEEPMAIIPEGKRQQVAALLGEDLTIKLEAGLLARGEKAITDGIEHKEETVVEDAEAEVEVVEDAQPEVPVDEAVVAEGEVSDSTDEGGDADAGTVEKDSDNAELAKALSAIVEVVSASQAEIVNAVNAQTERIDNIENSVAELSGSDKAKIAKMVSGTPADSLEAMLIERLGQSPGSVIGAKETLVHGNSALSKDKPLETEHDKETEEANSGLFFKQWK